MFLVTILKKSRDLPLRLIDRPLVMGRRFSYYSMPILPLLSNGRSQQPGNKPRQLLVVFAVIMLLVCVINYFILVYSQARLIEHEALGVAEVVTNLALTGRTVYTTTIANKLRQEGFDISADYRLHKGSVPLPAQFLKFVGQEVNRENNGLYRYKPLSKWNQDPAQGLQDDFQRWAWIQLEQQDRAELLGPINWRPVWRFETVNGVRTLRYMRADPASSEACVNCHNQLEQTPKTVAQRVAAGVPTGKQWKQHQLLGAIEADIPVDKVEGLALRQERVTLAIILLSSVGGLGVAAWIALRDVQRERKTAIYFQRQDKIDPLTNLGNRALFDERGQAILAHARSTNATASVLFIDLDGFKEINDNHGHATGDSALRVIAQRLVGALRESDLIARQGGDEFLVLLHGAATYPPVDKVVSKLLHALIKPVDVDGTQLHISASIGISYYPHHGQDLTTLIERADLAMYEAKRQGGCAYLIWGERDARVEAADLPRSVAEVK